jgi:peptide/nickel transport system permease protein
MSVAEVGVRIQRRPLLRLRRAGGALFWAGVVVLALLMFVSLFAPFLAPRDPLSIDLSHVLEGSSGQHLLGTDQSGRDIMSRLIFGARTSLLGPLGVVLVSTIVGVAGGVTAAWRGGWIDSIISRVSDLLFSFPGLLLAILAVSLFGSGLVAPVIALAIAYTPYVARLARSAALVERDRPYIAACRVQGFGGLMICVRHLVPNIAPVVLAQATIDFGYALIDLAALSFLGLGVQPPTADWGVMVSEGQASVLRGAPQQAMFAGAAIVVTVVAFNVIGEGFAERIARRRT